MTITILVKRPGQPGTVETIDSDDLEAMQALVGGYIQVVPFWPLDDDDSFSKTALVCNEDGKRADFALAPNFILSASDTVVGTVFFAGNDGRGEFTSLTDEQVARCQTYLRENAV